MATDVLSLHERGNVARQKPAYAIVRELLQTESRHLHLLMNDIEEHYNSRPILFAA